MKDDGNNNGDNHGGKIFLSSSLFLLVLLSLCILLCYKIQNDNEKQINTSGNKLVIADRNFYFKALLNLIVVFKYIILET